MNLPRNICIGLDAGVSGVCIGMAIFAMSDFKLNCLKSFYIIFGQGESILLIIFI